MLKETRLRRPSSATTASSGTETVESQHSRAGSRGSSAAVSAWTAADDDVLASARAAGMNWQPIATRFFPTKSANACRKRHERLMERRYQEEWEQDRLEELATAYFDCRKEMWAILGERLGERWGLVEGKCMEKGLKNLQTIARASQRKRIRLSEGDEAKSEVDHEDDSGIGLSDIEIEMSVNNRPSSAPAVGAKRSLSSSPIEPRRRPPQLPLYQPPSSAIPHSNPATMKSLASTTSIPFADSKASAPFLQRDILSIQAILSPAD
ncbi:Activator of stress proteins 1 [Elsinoe australis]|uniref:Activator of stress proteins 1 n=1 Tax=Elsinoe australis TaxID=40998 RepID=A0A2P8ABG7_9PEZI|nr:Activator of stress proteins 1 [Elsinoe australis]